MVWRPRLQHRRQLQRNTFGTHSMHIHTWQRQRLLYLYKDPTDPSEKILHTLPIPTRASPIPFPPHVPTSPRQSLSTSLLDRASHDRPPAATSQQPSHTRTMHASPTDTFLVSQPPGLAWPHPTPKKKKKTVNDNACNPIHVNAIRWGVIDTENLKSLLGRCAE